MNEKPKMIFGFLLLLVIFFLAVVIALGKVEEHTSYGLPFVLGSLSTLSGGFATWAFAREKDGEKPTSKPGMTQEETPAKME